MCPDFIWDGVNFHPSRWYSSVGLGFSVRVILLTYGYFSCFWVVFIQSQGLFGFLCSASQEVRKKPVGNTARTADLKLAKAIFSTREYHTQYTNWGELALRGPSLLGHALGISQWVINAIVHHLFLFGFYFSLFFLLLPFSFSFSFSLLLLLSSSSALLNLFCFNY